MAPASRIARILIVEDDASFRDLMLQVLRRHGHVVVGEGDGESALARLRAEHYDLLITDLVLPRKMGKDLLEDLHRDADRGEAEPPPPVILMSGVFRERDRAQFVRAHIGVRAFLHKPFTLPEFLKAVNAALADRGVDRPKTPVKTERSKPPPKEPDTGSTRAPAPPPVHDPVQADQFVRLSQQSSTPTPQRRARGRAIAKQKIQKRITVRFRSPADFLQEYADNIGNGGIFIRTTQPPEVGTRLRLHLVVRMDEEKSEEIDLTAEVVYTRPRAGAGLPAGLGVEFVDLSPELSATLKRVADSAYQDARTGRPLLVLIYRMSGVLQELLQRIPDADLRIRDIPDAAMLPVEAAGAEPSDLILIAADDVGETVEAVRTLKSDPATARVVTLVTGPESARARVLGADADAYFALPLEEQSFLTMATHLLTAAQRRQFVRARFRGEVRLKLDGVTIFARALDISEGGLGALVHGHVEKGATVDVELELGGPPVRARARIMWAGATKNREILQAGIRFEEISAADKKKVRNFISEAIRLSNYVRWVAGAGS